MKINKKNKKGITISLTIIVIIIALVIANKSIKKSNEIGFVEAIEGKFQLTIDATGELEAERSTIVRGPSIENSRYIRAERVKISDLVSEGTIVKKGDYVATLDRTEFDNQLKTYRTELENRKVSLDVAILDTSVTLSELRFKILNQEFKVEQAKTNWDNSKFESAGTLRQAEIKYREAVIALDQQKKSYELQVVKTRRNITRSRNRVEQIEQSIREYEEILDAFNVTAPSDGVIVYLKDFGGNKISSGSNIRLFEPEIASLPDLSSMLSKIYISETDISKIAVGQNVNITVDAFPEKTFFGSIYTIAEIGEQLSNSDSKVFEVMIKVNDDSNTLMPSMTSSNTIKIEEIPNSVMIPNDCVYTGSDSVPYVFTKQKKKQIVVLGSSNKDYIVVEQGLEAGEKIYPSIPEDSERFAIAGEEYIEIVKNRLLTKSQINNQRTPKADKSVAVSEVRNPSQQETAPITN